ncbi:MAG: patatin-like phospholipase family protein [Prevotella sp.]|nr:patatin-like phospholipase family protein [Prevotella sp.]
MKARSFFLIFIVALFVATSVSAQTERKKVAVVLSGGGAKGMAHVGALRVIERAGIPIDIITGTSMGSIVGGLYSIGYDSERLDSIVRRADWALLLSDRANLRSPFLDERSNQNTYALTKTIVLSKKGKVNNLGGVVEGKNLARLFSSLTAGIPDSVDFNKLTIPFACVATDIITNSEYDFHSGSLSEAMRASMSIPGVFTPIRKGEKLLVDGGLRNNYPADIAKAMGADVIIGVTVQGAPKTADDLSSGVSILSQIVDVNCKNKYDENLAMTDVAIRVDTKGYSAASFTSTAIDTLISRGEREAMAHWDELMALKREIGLPDDYRPERMPQPAGTDKLLETEDQYGSTVHAVKGSLGVRFDSEERVALQMNGVWKPAGKKMELGGTLRLGKRILGELDLRLMLKKRNFMQLSYAYLHSDLDVFNDGDRIFNLRYNRNTVNAKLQLFDIRNFKVSVGARFDYYHYIDVLVERETEYNVGDVTDEHLLSYYAHVDYNSEDKWTFPSRGANFSAGYEYHTDNFVKYAGHVGLTDVYAMWRMSFPLNSRLSIQPMFYGRMLFGDDQPFCLENFIGGDWFGHYVNQQMPFVGLGHIEGIGSKFIAAQLKLQQRIANNHYVMAKVVGAQRGDELKDLFDHGPIIGSQLSYAYNSMFGPLGASIGYNTKNHEAYFFVNLGFVF